MPFTVTNDFISGRRPVAFPPGRENITERFTLALAAADLAVNTIGLIGYLPAGCVPLECRVIAGDLDTGAGAGVYQVGILDAAGTAFSTDAADGGGAWGDTGAAVATAFDKLLTRTLINMASVTPTQTDRKIGVKVTTAPTTPAAGNLSVEITFRAARP